MIGWVPDGPVLRDIHVPEASFWPPAPGWWVLLGVALLAIFTGIWWLRRWRRRRKLWRVVEAEVNRLKALHDSQSNAAGVVAGLSQLMRRVARMRGALVHLDGAAWHAELDRLAPGVLDAECMNELRQALYGKKVDTDPQKLLVDCSRWLRVAVWRANA